MWRGVGLILGKDMRLRLRDRSVLLFAFVVPLGLTFLFSFIMPDEGDFNFTAGVIDNDGGQISAAFIDEALPALESEGVVDLTDVGDVDEAREAVADGEVEVVWVFPEGLSAAVTDGVDAEVDLLVSAGAALAGEVGRGVVDAYLAQVEQISLAVATSASVTGQPPTDELVAALAQAGFDPVVTVEDLQVGDGEPMDQTSFLAAGMASFFVFFTVMFGVTGLLEEREKGTMPRLRAAPIRPAAIYLGKLAGAFLLGLVSMTVLAVGAALLMDADWGPIPGVAILIVAIVIAAMGITALVGSFARTAEQASNLQSIVAIVLGMAGGVFFPAPSTVPLMDLLSLLSPHGWFLRAMSEQTVSGDWTVVLPAAGAIVAFGVVAAIPAVWRMRRSEAW